MPDNPLLDYIPSKNPLLDYVPKQETNPLLNYTPQKTSVLQKIQDHPVKAVMNPLFQTLTGKSLQERALEKTQPTYIKPGDKLDYINNLLRNAGAGMAGQVADIATTPATYVPLPIGKIIGKIPLNGTTVGEIASKLPLKKILNIGGAKEEIALQDALKTLPQKVAESQQPLLTLSPVEKIKLALQEVSQKRLEQEAVYSAERAKRLANVKTIGETQEGEQAFYKQLSALEGEHRKVLFEGLKNRVSQSDIDSLFMQIQRSPLGEWEKINAKQGLTKLLGFKGETVPAQNEIDLLKEVFPGDFIESVIKEKPNLAKIGDMVTDVINIPRALMATADMSAPLRQGIFFIGRPKQFLPAFGRMFNYFFDENSYKGLLEDIKARPTYPLMREAGLPLTDMGKSLSKREESFQSNLVEQIPLLKIPVKASSRAYSGFLNKLRADTFDDLIKKAEANGVDLNSKVKGKTVLKNIGEFVGTATGRGKMFKTLEDSAPLINGLFFSPRLMASRFQLLNPVYYTRLDPFTRKEALKSLFTFAGTMSTVLGLAKAGGMKIGVDPRSADFGKLKTGNTRYDVMGGFSQYIRLAYQLASGEKISSTTGVKTTVGEGYKPESRMDILTRFLETKEAPVASFITSLLKGKNFTGDPIDIPTEVAQRFVPMIAQDMVDLTKERGLEGVGMALPGIFGVGVQTYKPDAQEIVYSAKAAYNYAKTLRKQGRISEAYKMLDENKDIIEMGGKLKGFQDKIDAIRKRNNEIQKSVQVSEEQKNKINFKSSQDIKFIENQMNERLLQLQGK